MEMSKNCVFVFYFSPLQIKSLPQEPEEVDFITHQYFSQIGKNTFKVRFPKIV